MKKLLVFTFTRILFTTCISLAQPPLAIDTSGAVEVYRNTFDEITWVIQ